MYYEPWTDLEMHEDPRSGVGVTLDVAQGGHQAVSGVGGGGRGELGE